jgi:hypothetical protein
VTTATAEFTAGVYDGMPEDEYHGDPVPGGSLSSTGARQLLPPSCPALFKHQQDHPVFKSVFDYGSGAHKLVLGTGPKIELIDCADWKTTAAKDQRDAARANGFIPLLAHEFDQIKAMAAAIQDHPVAGALFDPQSGGVAEQSIFWKDELTGVWCRCRPDWLAGQRDRHGRLIIVDYKTTPKADVESIRRSIANYGYHQQAPFYIDGVRAVGLDGDPQFIFIFQEKAPPYLITPVQLIWEDEQVGRQRNRNAIERYRDCRESGIWPGHTDDIEYISLPPWARSREDYL